MKHTSNLLQRFLGSTSGVGTVEFAVAVPILLILYLGGVDLTRAVTFSHKLQNATTAVNDLVSQSTSLTKADVQKTFDAADVMLARYRTSLINIRVTTVRIDTAGVAKVQWSVARGMERLGANSNYKLSPHLERLRDYTLVITETKHDFLPIMTYVFKTSFDLSAQAQGRFRGRDPVFCKDCTS